MIRYVKIDETQHWREDIAKKAGSILGIYLYDDSVEVNCCEITPSYELYFVQSEFTEHDEDESKREVLFDEILEGDSGTELVKYMHCSAIRRMKTGELECDDMEEAMEYAHGNYLD